MENRMKKLLKLGTALAVAGGVSTVAYAQMKPEDAIRARQSIMRVVAINWGPIAGMAQDKIPFNKDAFVTNALRLESVWAMGPNRFFVTGSEKAVAGAKIAGFTDVKAEVWSNPDKFKAAFDKETQEIGKLAAAARAGDEKAMKAAAGDVGKACGGCHDDFRMK
jgi:cytochrome c556